ncbi:hypothetical protein [Streptomyces sp. NA04227]|uniref:hypothetical protein n=1 Tax=Streptomyces sp. NA04227 TaxID=2742136 RepID=UPI0020CA74C7|nr:hypothetical protein [Streptomyces sp. NA04227]
MTHNPQAFGEMYLSPHPRPLHHLSESGRRVLHTAELRAHGVPASLAAERSGPGGPWQQLLPGVHLLHPGAPTGEERLQAALLYAGRSRRAAEDTVPSQPGARDRHYGEAVVTGLAALAHHRFASVPPLTSLSHIDVLVPRSRRLRSAGFARVVRTHRMPAGQQAHGIPVAPVPRAVADAVARLSEPAEVSVLLTEAVREAHCEPSALVRELTRSRLMGRPYVAEAVDTLLAEGRALAEQGLYRMVREQALPDPLWNVDLRLPGGPHLGGVDAYWPDHSVALELDTGAPARHAPRPEGTVWSEPALKREHLERLGIAVVRTVAADLRAHPEQQAAVVRTALLAAADREPAPYLIVLPR